MCEVDRGSRFYVELPLTPIVHPPESERLLRMPTEHEERRPRPLPPLHVLAAEDNVVNQKVVCGILGRQGCTVEVANTGQEALIALFRDKPTSL